MSVLELKPISNFTCIDLLDAISLIAMAVFEGVTNKSNSLVRSREGILSSSGYLNKLLNCGNKKQIYGVLQIKKKTFLQLCNLFFSAISQLNSKSPKVISESRVFESGSLAVATACFRIGF